MFGTICRGWRKLSVPISRRAKDYSPCREWGVLSEWGDWQGCLCQRSLSRWGYLLAQWMWRYYHAKNQKSNRARTWLDCHSNGFCLLLRCCLHCPIDHCGEFRQTDQLIYSLILTSIIVSTTPAESPTPAPSLFVTSPSRNATKSNHFDWLITKHPLVITRRTHKKPQTWLKQILCSCLIELRWSWKLVLHICCNLWQ